MDHKHLFLLDPNFIFDQKYFFDQNVFLGAQAQLSRNLTQAEHLEDLSLVIFVLYEYY